MNHTINVMIEIDSDSIISIKDIEDALNFYFGAKIGIVVKELPKAIKGVL